MSTFVIALGLVAIFEGLLIALAPNYYQQVLQTLSQMSAEHRRVLGLLIAILGFITICLMRL